MKWHLWLPMCLLWAGRAPAQEKRVPLRVNGAVVSREYMPGLADAQRTDPEKNFLTTDPMAVFTFSYSGGTKEDKIRIECRNPFGDVYQKWVIDGGGNGPGWFDALPIAGAPASKLPGNWELRVFLNDKGVSTFPFTISVPTSGVVSLATKTILPRGTMTVPYYVQLRAEGGSAPYRWSLVGNAPPGLTLSPKGELTGVPSRRASYRLEVRVDDSAGNMLTRALGLGIGVISPGQQFTRRVLTKSPSSPDACATPVSATNFSTSDLTAWAAFSVEGAGPNDSGRIEWLNPSGEVESEWSFVRKADERRCYEFNMTIAGEKAASQPGNWRFRLFWREGEVFSLPFQISDGSEALLPGRRALVVANGVFKNLPPIPSVAAEATAVSQALRQDGFDVTTVQNSSMEELQRAESAFAAKLQRGDVAVVYFTGYGFQRNGDNWLPAANFDPADTRPTANVYSIRRLRGELEDKLVNLAMIVLDAAREQPALAGRAQGPGLARMNADAHTVLVYAVPPGLSEKIPGNATPGPFAQAFVKAIRTTGTGVQQLLQVDLPKAAAALAAGRPAPISLVETSEEFVFRTPAVDRPIEFVPAAAARQLSGTWEFGRVEDAALSQPCQINLTQERGQFGNVIDGRCANGANERNREIFWRLDGDRLYLVGIRGLVTSVLFKTSDDYWKGPYYQPTGVVHYLKRPGKASHQEVAIDSKLLAGYVGKYRLAANFTITVTSEGGRLFVQATGQQRFEAFPSSNFDFFLKAVDAQITFLGDGSGRATSLVLHQHGANQRAERIE